MSYEPGSSGPATDAGGAPVIDPTKNVLDLVAAAVLRIDDLRKEDKHLAKIEIAHVRELVKLRADERKRAIKDVRRLEWMRNEHAKELRKAEADRIDAIRAVDVQAVQQAAEVQATQAATLAATVATTAEASRSQVAAAASAQTIALAAALEPIQKDIQDLRKAQYEQQGQKAQATEGQSQSNINQSNLIGWVLAAGAAGALILKLVGG